MEQHVTGQLDTLSSTQKRDLLARLLAERGGATGDADLSTDQQRLWFLRQMEPEVPTHVCGAYAVSGQLDVAVLDGAIDDVLDAHGVLRTNVVQVEGRPMLVQRSDAGRSLEVIDLGDVPTAQADEQVRRILQDDARVPFDLAAEPLVRLTLVPRAAAHHTLLVVMHQMVGDQASVDLFVRELAARYEDAAPGSHVEPFAAAVARERAWLASGDAELRRSLGYWRTQLADVPVLELPTDRPRPAVRVASTRSARETARIDRSTVDGLRHLAEAHDTSLLVPLLVGYQCVLGRWANQSDLAVGWPHRDDGVPLGPRTTMLALRADLTGRPSLDEVVRRARATVDGAVAHRRVPFERVVEELGGARDMTRSPVFQVVFDVVDAAAGASWPVGSAVRWAPVALDPGSALFDLALVVHTDDDGARLDLDHATQLWGRPAMRRFLDHLSTMYRQMATGPDTRIGQVALVRDEERAALLEEWNDTGTVGPSDDCLHDLVAAQARRTPDRTALSCGGVRLTYRELDERANRLAHHLQDQGVTAERLVAVAADRSADSVVGILAILKAGGAYLPFDPATPARRLRYVLEHADVHAVLARRAQLADVPATAPTSALDPDAVWSTGPVAPPERRSGPDNLAYCVFTSGSTGQPKGVLITHRQIVWSTRARSDAYPRPIDGYLMLAPLFFDASCAGLYWTLAEGGTLVMPTDNQIDDPLILGRLIEAENVSHFDSVPSQYAVFLESQPGATRGLRCCIVAGEELTPALAAQHHRVAPQAALFNEYGATEVTVWATVHRHDPDDGGTTVPVGRPITGARVYVLDDEGQPTPVGVPGEVYVGGPGVARGYVGRPGETAERFVPDPFGPPGTRLYRIGDIARHRADGALEFAGRADDQVKIRGFRVEPREVERTLLDHPDVSAAAVVVRHGRPGDAQLVAYVVSRVGDAVGREAVVAFLRERVPEYMIPSHVVAIDELPLTAQGKVDRRALPEPGAYVAPPTAEPRTPLEKGVASIFADVLGLEHVGIHDDFFDIGGNSLHLARVGARLSDAYEIDLPVHQFFSVPTVAGVGAMLELYRRKGQEGVLATRDPAEVAAEATLDDAITADGLPTAAIIDPSAVLLTGATGYLGVYLLEQLLRDTTADVHCLVRADDEAHALQRIRRIAEKFELELDPSFERRVRPVLGDLARPRLGLSEDAFSALASTIDAIVHNGALVNFSFPYSRLKPPNVLGTLEVLRLACTDRVKAVHYISTMDVLIGSHTPRPFLEVDLPEQPLRVPFSYPESKWVAEKLVTIARSRGVPAVIYRPGMMMGHTRTGACHETDYLLVGLRGFLRMGILPEFPEIMNSVTVDYAAEAIVRIFMRDDALGKVFHVWNLDAVPTMRTYDWVRSFGFDFEVEPYDTALERAMQLTPDHPLYPLLPVLFLYRSGDAGTNLTWEVHQTMDVRAECANTLAALGAVAEKAEPLTERWMHDLLAFLIAAGHLESPDLMRRGLEPV